MVHSQLPSIYLDIVELVHISTQMSYECVLWIIHMLVKHVRRFYFHWSTFQIAYQFLNWQKRYFKWIRTKAYAFVFIMLHMNRVKFEKVSIQYIYSIYSFCMQIIYPIWFMNRTKSVAFPIYIFHFFAPVINGSNCNFYIIGDSMDRKQEKIKQIKKNQFIVQAKKLHYIPFSIFQWNENNPIFFWPFNLHIKIEKQI